MSHGGARPNAGRKAGTANKRTREIADKAALDGETPLEYMLRVMRDKTADEKRRDAMAVAAGSYIHPRLSSIEANVKATMSHEETLKHLEDDAGVSVGLN